MTNRTEVSGTAGPSTASDETSYRKLEGSEIRLLSVEPGSWRERVSCTLHYIPLDMRPKYAALSYAWGKGGKTREILLNGKKHAVTRSLFTALRRFRRLCSAGDSFDGYTFFEGMYLWADAVCINQKDDREKEVEIPRMRDIYILSSRVCTWLGENEDRGGDATRLKLQEVLQSVWYWCVVRTVNEHKRDDIEVLKRLWQMIEEKVGACFDDLLDVLYDLAAREWFFRMWVIQETALPVAEPILIAGRFLFSFTRFTSLCEICAIIWAKENQRAGDLLHQVALLFGRLHTHRSPRQFGQSVEERQQQFGQAFEAAILRWGGGAFGASVSHDYMYSMIGLCGGEEAMPPALAPDYKKPFPKVCEDYARFIVQSTGSVAILRRDDCRPGLGDKLDGVPSWVPDFRAWQAPMEVDDPDSSAVSFVGPGGRFLKVRGFDLGKVTAVYLPLGWENEGEEEDEDYDIGDHLRHHDTFLRHVSRERNIKCIDVVIDWLCEIAEPETVQSPPQISPEVLLYWYFSHISKCGFDSLLCQSLFGQDVSETFVRSVQTKLTEKRVFLCQGGVCAKPFRRVCPRRGDHLVALSGSVDPFLLRPVLGKGVSGYTLLTHCTEYDSTSQFGFKRDDFRVLSTCNSTRKLESFLII